VSNENYALISCFLSLTVFPGTGACSTEPCENGATCVVVTTGYKCVCPSGFVGNNCETGKSTGTSYDKWRNLFELLRFPLPVVFF